MKWLKKHLLMVWENIGVATKITGLFLFVFATLTCFKISDSIWGFTWFLLGAIFIFSVQVSVELKGWLSKKQPSFFRKRNLFMVLGLLVADIVIIVLCFYFTGETVYQTKKLLIVLDIILSSALALILSAFIPLAYMTISMMSGPSKSSQVSTRISTRKLILIPIYSILGLVGLWLAIMIMGWAFYNTQEFVSSIYWDKYFCGPSKIEKATDSIVRIETEDGSGSGFWIDDDLVLTNNHVVLFDDNITVIAGGNTFPADVVQTDTIKDLAILRIRRVQEYNDGRELTKYKSLKWRKRWPSLAEDVYVLGFPEGTKDKTVSRGIVSSLTSDKYDDTKYIQTDAAINPGNSGGPLVDICGRVLGISSSTLLDAENIGFAIDGSRIKDQLEEMKIAGNNITSEELEHGQTGGETETVTKYYLTISKGDFEDAYDFYSAELKARVLFKGWKDSYKNTFAIRFKSAKKVSDGVVEVSFISVDLPNSEKEDYTTREFTGTWKLVKESGIWKLSYSNVREVTQAEE